jgi:glucokinase
MDIGGTKIAAAYMDETGRIGERRQVATPKQDGESIVQTACELLRAMQQAHPQAQAVGVGSAGQVDPLSGTIRHAVGTLPGWTGMPLAQRLREAVGLPVFAENDVNAMALGECRAAEPPIRHALFVAVGTGIGGALLFDGRLWGGQTHSAGELGHALVDMQRARRCTCGDYGHLEAYASGPALARQYDGTDDLRRAVIAADHDSRARQIIEDGARLLGWTLAGLLCTVDAGLLIVGGGVAEIGPLWWQPFVEALRQSPMPAARYAEIRRAALGTDAVLYGAAHLAWENFT